MIQIGQSTLSLEDFAELVIIHKEVTLDKAAIDKVKANFKFLQNFSSNKLIYGINTGFGPMAQYKVSQENLLKLQYNLIRSHSSGSGNLLSPILVKALMIARLNSMMQGYSGVHTDVVQLAHLGLVLIGEGEGIVDGQMRPTAEVFTEQNINPLTIHVREGLAI